MRLLCTMCVLGSMLGCVVVEGQSAASDEAQGKVWWAHVQYLADPSMNGRLTGSEEYLRAAAYVVEQFKAYGLAPAGVDGGFYQPVKFDVQRVIASKSSMSLVVDGKVTPLVLGEDAILGSRSAQLEKVDAPLVFIGYGLHLPESKYDDFNSAEVPLAALKGKIVVLYQWRAGGFAGAAEVLCADGSVCEGAARCGGGGVDFDSDAEVDGLWLAAGGERGFAAGDAVGGCSGCGCGGGEASGAGG